MTEEIKISFVSLLLLPAGTSMKKLLPIVCSLLIATASISAQQKESFSQRSYERARRVLDRGVEAIGDSKRLEALGDITLQWSAKAVEIGQSAGPTAAYYVTQAEGTRVLDFQGKRSYQELNTHFLGEIPLRLKEVVTEKGGFTVELTSNVVYPVSAASVAGSIRAAQSFFPQYLLAFALSRAGSLRWAGEADYEGRKQEVITFSQGSSTLTLFFDAKSHLLTKSEGLGDSSTFGVAANELIFEDYRSAGSARIPYHLMTKYAGLLTTDLSIKSVSINTHPDDSLFATPRGAEFGPETGGPLKAAVTKLAPDVYYVSNGLSFRGNFFLNNIFFYTQLLVVFHDYVVVVEAPLNDELSQAVLAKVREIAPGKPVKYVVPTHYHSDHLGGVRGYIAEGATVLTTPGNKGWIERVASAALPFNPDTLSRNPRPLNIESFTDRRVLTDGEHTVELYNIGGPHSDEMVIAYLPKEKIVFASDIAGLFAYRPEGQLAQANAANADFVDKVKKLGLLVETVASGHGRIEKMDDLRKAVALRAADNH
jgi:glyoxylase-like metal-dependent hydrolase (beta-lactamase superfamily II)